MSLSGNLNCCGRVNACLDAKGSQIGVYGLGQLHHVFSAHQQSFESQMSAQTLAGQHDDICLTDS